MTLKTKVDDTLRRVYFLTESIKKLEPGLLTNSNKATKMILGELLREYIIVSKTARELLHEYIQEQRETGVTPIEYVRLYRKLGEEASAK